jgi:hypothetical protein
MHLFQTKTSIPTLPTRAFATTISSMKLNPGGTIQLVTPFMCL